jgi:hypothetical protein
MAIAIAIAIAIAMAIVHHKFLSIKPKLCKGP